MAAQWCKVARIANPVVLVGPDPVLEMRSDPDRVHVFKIWSDPDPFIKIWSDPDRVHVFKIWLDPVPVRF